MLALTSRKIPDSHKTAQTLGLQISFFIAQKRYKGIKTICEKMNLSHLLPLWSVSDCPGIKSANIPKKINAANIS